MESLGIKTIGELSKYDVQRLVAIFGKVFGTYLHHASLGIGESPVRERGQAESISRISTLKENTRNLGVVLERANQLCEEVHARLMPQGFSFKTVGIVAVMADMSIRSRSKTFENPTNELALFKRTVKELFEKLLSESELEARRIGVKLSNFVKRQEKQKRLTSFIGTSAINSPRF